MGTPQPYWDGTRWVMPPMQQSSTGVLAAGWVFAILFPIVGFVIGLTQINRSREGLWIVLASVGAGIFYFWAFSGGVM